MSGYIWRKHEGHDRRPGEHRARVTLLVNINLAFAAVRLSSCLVLRQRAKYSPIRMTHITRQQKRSQLGGSHPGQRVHEQSG